MSLWGNKDLVCNGGSIAINLTTGAVTGTATTFNTAGFVVSEGDVLVVGAGATFGHAVIDSVTSNTAITVKGTGDLIPNPDSDDVTKAAYVVTQMPISAINDVHYAAPDAKSNRTSSVLRCRYRLNKVLLKQHLVMHVSMLLHMLDGLV